MPIVGYGTAISQLAAQSPDSLALVCNGGSTTRAELDQSANRLARAYQERGIGQGDLVSIALPNSTAFVLHCLAAWKVGAVPNPISHLLPAAERSVILERAQPKLIISDDDSLEGALPGAWSPPPSLSSEPLADVIPPHERALASGGSTGTPKLIVIRAPAAYDSDLPKSVLFPAGCVLIPGPLYHAAPLGSLTQALLAGVPAVVMGRFDAALCLEMIERHRVEQVLFVPTMLHRIWRLPETTRRRHDVSSLRVVYTGGAPCPQWLMRAFIDWLGADVMHELYGPSERIGGTHITGREWLDHPGSVGRATAGAAIRILAPQTHDELPPRAIGEVFMMPRSGAGSTYRYVGADSRTTEDGWESVGDMGYLDEDGYLYLTDRRTDMILCGGRNIYPAQIEAAIDAHPAVLSSAVIGLPDDDLGQRVHAIVQASETVTEDELRAHLTEHVARYCIPRTFELVDFPLRDDAGKVRRYQLREQRLAPR